MKCKKCDKVISNDIKFCPECGTKVSKINLRKIILIIIPCVILILSRYYKRVLIWTRF